MKAFESTQTKEKFNIYHKCSCKSKYVIHLLGCLLCKPRYAGKLEILSHIKLDVKDSQKGYKRF